MVSPSVPGQATGDSLDEAYERLHRYGPEFDGYLSNHGPMVVEVLDRRGLGDASQSWLDVYVRRLEEAPPIGDDTEIADWQALLGDPSQLGRWLGAFTREINERPWRDVLATWWPRLLPGSVASATHSLIRTGHAVRALLRQETQPRLNELAQGLAYWAGRWQPLPGAGSPHGELAVDTALSRLPHLPDSPDNMDSRLTEFATLPGWPEAVEAACGPAQTSDVPDAVDSIVDAAVVSYVRNGYGDSIMLVHAATAPAALRAMLADLPEELWRISYDAAWAMTAAVTAMYAPEEPDRTAVEASTTGAEALERALDNGDEHVIKFTDVAVLAHERGSELALEAASRADVLMR